MKILKLPYWGIARLAAFALALAMLGSFSGCSAAEWEAQTIDPRTSVSASDILGTAKDPPLVEDADAAEEPSAEDIKVTPEQEKKPDPENAADTPGEDAKTSEEEPSPSDSDNSEDVSEAETDRETESEPEEQQKPEEQESNAEPEVSEPAETVFYTYTELTQTLYATTALNVRSGPSADFEIIGGYAKGGAVSVTGQCDQTSWYRVAYGGAVGYVSDSYVDKAPPAKDTNPSPDSKVTSYDGYVIPKGSISVSMLEQANANAAKLPQAVRDAFVNSGWTMYISQADIDDTYCNGKYGSVLGLSISGAKTIYLANNQEGISYATIVHESGHFWDWYWGWPSQTDEFAAIYAAEWSAFKSTFNYSNGSQTSYELFAEGFYRYLVSGDQLKASCPKTYSFLAEYCNF